MGPSTLTINAIEGAEFFIGRQEIDPEGYSEAPAVNRTENDIVKQYRHGYGIVRIALTKLSNSE